MSATAPEGPEIVVVPDPATLSRRAAELIARLIAAAVAGRGVAHVALTGGSTPAGVFDVLAAPPLRDAIPWAEVHLWWGDDRFVPRDDPRSNLWIADHHLFSGAGGGPGIPIPVDRVHPFPCSAALAAGLDPDACAAGYAAELRREVPTDGEGWPVFDLVLVGIGADGHLLSVFPGSAAFDSRAWALGVPVPMHIEPHVPRVTLNPAVVGASRAILAMVQGIDKAAIVATLFGPAERDPRRWPAQLALRPGATWILDEPAAADLPPGRRPDGH